MVEKLDLNKIQQEVNNLVEKRLKYLSDRRLLESERDKAKSGLQEIKSGVDNKLKAIEKELVAIDKLFQEKLDMLNKYRGG